MNTAPKSPNIGSIGKPLNNSMKSLGTATSSTMNSIGNATTSALNSIGTAANNTFKSVNKSVVGAVNNAANVASNFGNSIRNIGTPIKNSIEAIPVSASTGTESMLPSFLTLPIVFGIAIISLLITLVYFYQEQISTSLQDLSKSIGDLFKTDPAAEAAAAAAAKQDAAATAATEEDAKDPADLPEPAAPHKSVIDSLIPKRKQVFNISENKYTYADAEPLCKALGAELATYDQVKKSWDSGADWCNYGWIKGQAAVYPTQKSTFDRLQSSSNDDERLSCGTVGVNGGFMDNPELRFGVTCYGDKPSQSEHDVQNMMKGPNPPLTPEVLAMKKKELRYKQHSNEIGVMPFNEKQW